MERVDFTSILHQVTLDSKDNGVNFYVTARLDAIKKLLQVSDYNLIKQGELFLLYGKQPLKNQEIVLISSHIDCVYHSCFSEENSNYYKGTFDNSLTNAAVLYNMLTYQFAENVVIAFTGDEEKNSGGCKELITYLVEETQCILKFALVTDVTNEGWHSEIPFTIENDLGIDLFTAHQLVETLTPFTFGFVHEAEPDESWEYDEAHIPCLTLCVPVLGDMHSDEGVLARKALLPEYCAAMHLLANVLAS